MTRDFFITCLQLAIPTLNIVPGKPFVVELAGGKSTTLSGDSVRLSLQIDTMNGPVRLNDRFFNLPKLW